MFAWAALSAALYGQDARQIVRMAIERFNHSTSVGRQYGFFELDVQRQFDDEGKLKSTRSRTFDITTEEDSPYRRLVARDGKPLNVSENANEMAKFHYDIEQRRRETPSQRAKRMAEWEKRQDRQRKFLREIPEAFEFTVLRVQRLDGRNTWVIRAQPKPDYHPTNTEGRVLSKLAGTFWIDKADLHCVRLEAQSVETITFGWLLVRVSKGASLRIAQTRVNGEVWFPKHVFASYRARIGLIKLIAGENEYSYSNYRKLQAGSRSEAGVPAP
ncbi:MAG: hypothetical protein LLG20_24460 [Acidobacteriales bacterium]|nr:hypothetical protein [Terriglobales bacterium]